MKNGFQVSSARHEATGVADLSLAELDAVAGGFLSEIIHETKELMNNNTVPACGWLVCSDGSK